jgi:hypothetical protein
VDTLTWSPHCCRSRRQSSSSVASGFSCTQWPTRASVVASQLGRRPPAWGRRAISPVARRAAAPSPQPRGGRRTARREPVGSQNPGHRHGGFSHEGQSNRASCTTVDDVRALHTSANRCSTSVWCDMVRRAATAAAPLAVCTKHWWSCRCPCVGRIPVSRRLRCMRGETADQGVGNVHAMGRHDPPPHPASQARVAVIPPAVQAPTPAQHANAPREARPPPPSPPPPGGPLLGDPCRGRLARLREDHAVDAGWVGHGLMGGRRDPAVRRPQPRRRTAARRMGREAVWHGGELWAGLREAAGAADEAAFPRLQPPLTAAFPRVSGLPPDHHLGVRLTETPARGPGRPHVCVHEAPERLIAAARPPWPTRLERPNPRRRPRGGLCLPHGAPVPRWGPSLLGYGQQPLRGRPPRARGRRALAAGPPRPLASLAADPAHAPPNRRRPHHGRGAPQQPAAPAPALAAQAAVRGGMTVRLHHGAVHAPRAPAGPLQCTCQRPHALVACGPRRRRAQGGPAPPRRVVRHGGHGDAAALPPPHALGDEGLGGLIAPVLDALHHQPSQAPLDGRGGPPTGRGGGGAPAEVGLDALAEDSLV